MYSPYITNNEGGDTSDSDTDTFTSDSSSESSADGQMDAITHWQNAARALLGPTTVASSIPAVGDTAAATPEAVGTDNGMFNTRIQFEEKRHTHVIMVNSLDRDQNVYPLPTQMRLKLPRLYKNVERIDIVQIKFFCGLYAISAARKNNTIAVDVSGSSYTVTIPDGTYSLSQLVASLQAALIGVESSFTVSFSPISGRITIAAGVAFSLPFQSSLPSFNQAAYSEWGLGWNLGWGGQPIDLSGSSSYTADHFPRLIDDYIYLQMNDTEHMNEIDHTAVEKTGKTQDSTGQVAHYFGKLLLNNFGCWAQTFVEAPKTFKPVLGRLERLNFTWTDRHGLAIAGPDAASCDWHMALRITEIVEVPTADSSLAQSADRGSL
jgi:hypothetical protein